MVTAALCLAVTGGCSTRKPARSGVVAPASQSEAIADAVPDRASPLPLADVRLTGGPLKHAQELDAAYLLELDPDRLLFYLRQRAGLPPKAREPYGGWDGAGRQLTGHIAGHYLSAVSEMYAATGDPRFKQRADYLVGELAAVQQARGNGYIGAIMANVRAGGKTVLVDGLSQFSALTNGVIRSGGFDLNGMWSPWYVEHKLFAGLRDAYRLTGNRQALQVEIQFAGWADGVLSHLNETQIQQMLNTEFGGMNEVMADLYADTGDPRWRRAFAYFQDHSLVDPLARRQDILAGKHGNTQIPKLLGDGKFFRYTGDPASGAAADFFWDAVVYHHTFATGGHGKDEYFGPPDKLNEMVDGRDCESCNVYNMLKLTRLLFARHPDAKYAEFQERALFNHVLASMDSKDGRMCYMVPVGRGATHEYQDMFRDFTCCVGTGMENHALLGDGIYYASGDQLWVNLYTPSLAKWKAKQAAIEVQSDFPEGDSVQLVLHLGSSRKFTLALRRPLWAGEGFAASVNGAKIPSLPRPGAYAEISRRWREGDVVELTLPKKLHIEPVPDNPRRAALMWGPLVLAGDVGPEDWSQGNRDDLAVVPVFVTGDRPISDWLKPVAGAPGNFRTAGVGHEREVTLVPFYRLHERAYAVYWDLYTQADWNQRAAEIAAERERQRRLALATVAYAQPGEMQSERDFNEQGEDSEPDRIMGRPARRGRSWFSFDLPVDPVHPEALVVTYNSDEWRKRTFAILVDGQKIADQTVEQSGSPHFFDEHYAIPLELVKGKQKVTIRFQAADRSEIAAVFGLRMIRTDAINGALP